MPVRVTLFAWEYGHALYTAKGRAVQRFEQPHKKVYDEVGNMEPNLTGHLAGAVCEVAVGRLLNLYVPGHFWDYRDHAANRHIPDVGNCVEVKRVRKAGNPARLFEDQVGLDLFIVVACPVAPDFRVVDVLGWHRYDDAWIRAKPTKTPGNRELDAAELLPIETARLAIRERYARGGF